MNNFFSLVLFSAVIHTRRGMKLMSKIIKYKLDSSSRMQFAFLYPKDIKKKKIWETIDFIKNMKMTQTGEVGRHVLYIITTHAYENR